MKLSEQLLRFMAVPRTMQQCREAFGNDRRVKFTVQNLVARGEAHNLRADEGRSTPGLYVRTSSPPIGSTTYRGPGPRPEPTLDWTTSAELHTAWMRAMRAPRATDRRA